MISSARNAMICGCGDPYQMASVPKPAVLTGTCQQLPNVAASFGWLRTCARSCRARTTLRSVESRADRAATSELVPDRAESPRSLGDSRSYAEW